MRKKRQVGFGDPNHQSLCLRKAGLLVYNPTYDIQVVLPTCAGTHLYSAPGAGFTKILK